MASCGCTLQMVEWCMHHKLEEWVTSVHQIRTLDSYYVTISNGIYSTKDKKVITGVPDVNAYGFNDGSFTEARFGHLINLALLQPGMLAVADYTSNRVRLVDVLGETVSTLCVNTSCTVKEPISVTLVGSKTLLVGTHTGFSSIDLSWSPVNLCYGVYNSGETVIKVDGVSMKVWCDLDTPEGPWITLLNRYDGSVDFNRTYQSYTDGFGDLSGEHWLEAYNGGWWFSHCYTVCLTCGPYYDRAKGGTGAAMIYYPYTLRKTSLKSASMKVKLPESSLWTN
ncbi:hypothetical protein EB796_004980 [Bugula neritina]|uniref:Fibrinogen C-terminal domain-containing protein n=1 Tax=Bugula neritina TaxID=10212 RepID=A0A7J7KGD1_BUGNE|nr:hypothetical protein EB796_004980 [Bugula neritina]